MAKGESPKGKGEERAVHLTFLGGYGGFVVGTLLIPFAPTVGGIIFWLGVVGIFWAGWLSAKK